MRVPILSFRETNSALVGTWYVSIWLGEVQRDLSREQQGTFFGAGLRLRPTRGVASPLPRHGVHQGSPLLVKGDDGLWWLGKISANTTEDGV